MPLATERTLVELAQQLRERYYGKYRGIVTDNADPQAMGRIKALVPAVLETEVTPWALPCAPFAGVGSGQFTMPAIDAGVWIEFEAGDPSQPIWTGCWWGQGEIPNSQAQDGGSPGLKVIRSESGLLLSMDDDGQSICLSDADGSNILSIEVGSGEVLLKGANKVTVEAPQICLVENARHPVVFGDELLNYLTQLVTLFQTHTHPGELAAGIFPVTPMVPVPTFPMPRPSLLSSKVKSG